MLMVGEFIDLAQSYVSRYKHKHDATTYVTSPTNIEYHLPNIKAQCYIFPSDANITFDTINGSPATIFDVKHICSTVNKCTSKQHFRL